jgi:hypothetical protein
MDLQELVHCFERVIYKYMFHCLEGVIRVILPGGGLNTRPALLCEII